MCAVFHRRLASGFRKLRKKAYDLFQRPQSFHARRKKITTAFFIVIKFIAWVHPFQAQKKP